MIGFDGGQTLGLRVPTKALQQLQQALNEGTGGWHEVVDEAGGKGLLDLGRIVYVRIEPDEHRVGFSR
jgi:hypothetical protein